MRTLAHVQASELVSPAERRDHRLQSALAVAGPALILELDWPHVQVPRHMKFDTAAIRQHSVTVRERLIHFRLVLKEAKPALKLGIHVHEPGPAIEVAMKKRYPRPNHDARLADIVRRPDVHQVQIRFHPNPLVVVHVAVGRKALDVVVAEPGPRNRKAPTHLRRQRLRRGRNRLRRTNAPTAQPQAEQG